MTAKEDIHNVNKSEFSDVKLDTDYKKCEK